MSQQMEALRSANATRQEIAEIRRRVSGNPEEMRKVLLDPPAALRNYALVDVLRLGLPGRNDGSPRLVRAGKLALRDGVNLMVPLGRASRRTREWAMEHGVWRPKGRAGSGEAVR